MAPMTPKLGKQSLFSDGGLGLLWKAQDYDGTDAGIVLPPCAILGAHSGLTISQVSEQNMN